MDKCAALTTMLENQPDKLMYTLLSNGQVALAGMDVTFTPEEVEMMLQRRFGLSPASAARSVQTLRKTGSLEQTITPAMLPPQKTANTAVVVDMYETEYTPKTLGQSTQEIDRVLDTIKDFVTRYTFPDTVLSDILVGPRQEMLKKKEIGQSTSEPPATGEHGPMAPPAGPAGHVPPHAHAAGRGPWRPVVGGAQDVLHGGRADTAEDSQFNPAQLAQGIREEQEHTDNPLIAKEIAEDHLINIPDYYTRLKTMEQTARTHRRVRNWRAFAT